MTKITKDWLVKGKVPEIPLKKLKKLWASNCRTEEIAAEFQVSLPYLYLFAKRHKLPKRTHVKARRRKPGEKEIDPTPEEIIARTEEVRNRWTEQEYERNNCCKAHRPTLRTYAFNTSSASFSEISRLN